MTLSPSELQAARKLICEVCGSRPATCVGTYDDEPYSFGCDECCGHGCEDGVCFPLDEVPQRLEIGRTNWLKIAAERDSLTAQLAAMTAARDRLADLAHEYVSYSMLIAEDIKDEREHIADLRLVGSQLASARGKRGE